MDIEKILALLSAVMAVRAERGKAVALVKRRGELEKELHALTQELRDLECGASAANRTLWKLIEGDE